MLGHGGARIGLERREVLGRRLGLRWGPARESWAIDVQSGRPGRKGWWNLRAPMSSVALASRGGGCLRWCAAGIGSSAEKRRWLGDAAIELARDRGAKVEGLARDWKRANMRNCCYQYCHIFSERLKDVRQGGLGKVVAAGETRREMVERDGAG
jgi:hypothetical protein